MPSVIAGFMCPPDTGPITYTMPSTEKPNASATPSWPMPGASTAVPTPPPTSTAVPSASAPKIRALFCMGARYSARGRRPGDADCGDGGHPAGECRPRSVA
jgi:hypothetical protein